MYLRKHINILKSITADYYIKIFGTAGAYSAIWNDTNLVQDSNLKSTDLAELRLLIDKVISERTSNDCIYWCDKEQSDNRIFEFERFMSEAQIDKLGIDEKLREISKYLGKPTRHWFLMANKLIFKNANVGSGGGVHRDSPFSNQIKIIWYLNDVDGANGPFTFQEGTHARAHTQEYKLGEMRFEKMIGKRTEVTGKAGTMVICDTKCVHGGKPMTTGVRYAITLYSFSRNSKRNQELTNMRNQNQNIQ